MGRAKLFRIKIVAILLCLLASYHCAWANTADNQDMQITVNKFRLDGFTPYPQYNISTTAIIDLLRQSKVYYGKQISLTELQLLTDRITRYYHQQGLTNIQVFLPPQKLDSDTIILSIESVDQPVELPQQAQAKSPETKSPETAVMKIPVKHFVLQDFRQYPELGITGKNVHQLISQSRGKFGRQLSLDDLNSIANDLTRFYHDKGFGFTKAYIPPQTINSGTVNIAIAEGKLGDIHVYNTTVYTEDQIKKAFIEQRGKAIHKPTIEQGMTVLRRYPGLKVLGYYTRGEKPGEANLNIKVRYQQQWYASLRADNFGSDSTGERRVIAQATINNPLKNQDQLTVGIQQSFDNDEGEDNLYGLIRYTTPLWNMDNELTLTVTNSDYEIGESFSSLDLEGDAKIYRGKYTHHVFYDNYSHHQLSLFLTHKTSDIRSRLPNISINLDDESSAASLSWESSWMSKNRRWLNGINVIYTNGEFDMETTNTKGQHFDKGNLLWNTQYSLGNPAHAGFSILKLNITSQFSEQRLPNLEQLLLTGPYSVRALKPGFFSADRGGIARAEWHMPRLFTDFTGEAFKLSPFLFGDIAHGEKLGLDDNVIDRATVSGYGLGLELSWKDQWSLTASVQDIDRVDSDIQYQAEKRSLLIETQYLMP